MATVRQQPAPKVGKGWGGAFCDLCVAAVVATGKGTWWLFKHPVPLLGASVLLAGVFVFSERTLTLALLGTIVSPAVWAAAHPQSFRQVGVAAVRDGWRRYTVYQQGWHNALSTSPLMKRSGTEALVPKIVSMTGTEFFDQVTVKMLPMQTHELFQQNAKGLASTFGTRRCVVREVERRRFERGTRIRLDFQRKDALAPIVPPYPIPIDEPVDLEAVPIGLTEYGKPWLLELLGTHILVGGATGAGKASVLWSILRGIAPAVRDGLVELWGFDAKNGMELEFGKPMFTRYWGKGCDVEQHAAGLHELVEIMEARSDSLAGMTRKHEPTLDNPLIVCVIDEMADLTTYDVKKVRDQINGDLARICRRARSVGISLVMFLQDPRKDAVPFRDQIPHGIGLRLKSVYEVDAVLGPHAYTAGADCPNIPGKPGAGSSVDGRGIAYVTRPGEATPERVRASFVTDDDIAEMARVYPAFKRPVVVDSEMEVEHADVER